MVRASLKEASRIERKPHVPDKHRTHDRTKVADWIEEHAANEWQDWKHREIAEETGYSRQHVDKVVEYYFQPEGESGDVEALADILELGDVTTLQQAFGVDVSRELLIYRMGYRDGQRDAQDEAKE